MVYFSRSARLLSALGMIFMGAIEASSIITTSPDYRFELDFSALILKPMESNLHYAAVAFPLPIHSPHWNIHDIRSEYHFGFTLGLAAYIHERDTVVRAEWERFHASDSSSVQIDLPNMIGPFFAIGPDTKLYTQACGKVTIQFDELNLTYGKQIAFGDYADSTLYAGVSFAHLTQTLVSTYSNRAENIDRTIQTPIIFEGAGPQIGANFSYDIMCGLQLSGSATASLLVGRTKNCTTYSSRSPALTEILDVKSPNVQTTTLCARTILVPTWKQTIGLAYHWTFHDCYAATLAAGYQAQIYINALQAIDMGSEVVTPPVIPDTVGVFARTFQRNISNFSLAGPYVTLEIAF